MRSVCATLDINSVNMGYLELCVVVLITSHIILKIKQNWSWLYGLFQTVFAVIFARRPNVFKTLIKEELIAPDEEKYVVWWTQENKSRVERGEDDTSDMKEGDTAQRKLWVLLPGGMTSADTFYTWDAIKSGLFEGENWCIFHNPGIVNKCHNQAPPALTETKYIAHFISQLNKKGVRVSIIGFSAGSMLTIAMAKQADEMDKANILEPSSVRTLDCCVAVHGPDRIRDVFENFRNNTYSRLDILFSFSLYKTMCNSGCTRFLPINAGGGLHKNKLVWLKGWSWMKSYTESVFKLRWDKMEDRLWSCHSALSTPLKTPVMRILSINDPIVDFAKCCNPTYFCNVDKLYLQQSAGHCCAFRYDKDLASHIRQWRNEKIENMK